MFKTALYWFAASLLAIIAAFVYKGGSLDSDMAVFIWVLSGVIVLYLAKKKEKPKKAPRRNLYIAAGLLIAASSFANEITGQIFWNPPYSIGEITVLLSGLSVAFFAYMAYTPLILPAAFPAITVFCYQLFEIYQENINWIAAPLLYPSAFLSTEVLKLLGVGASMIPWDSGEGVPSYAITFLTTQGQTMTIAIVIDCTGIWSLSAFTASIILVSLAFRQIFTKKGLAYVAVGYLGTYAANILRIVAICMSAYLYGNSGATFQTHVHAGWIAFSAWMLIFWYLFFSRFLLKKEGPKQK